MKHIFFVLLMVLAVHTAVAQTKEDKLLMDKAAKELKKTGNCNRAWDYLRQVSEKYKTEPQYLLLQARVYDCRYDKALAVEYYKKYLEQVPGNDSVSKRISTLERSMVKADGTKERRATTSAKEKAEAEKMKKAQAGLGYNVVSENDYCLGLSTDVFLSSKKAPFRRGYNFFNFYEFKLPNDRLTLHSFFDFGLLTNGNKQWAATALDVPDTLISNVGPGVQYGIHVGLNYLLRNTRKYALSVGPYFGFNAFSPSSVRLNDNYGSKQYNSRMAYSVLAGANVSFYVGRHLYFSAEFAHPFRKSFKNDLSYAITDNPYNGSMLRFGIGFKGLGSPYDMYGGGYLLY